MKKISFFLVIFLSIQANVFGQLQVAVALCENKINPAGVALQHLRFGWELASTEKNQLQTAYQLVVASLKEKLNAGVYDIYNFGIVKTAQSVMVPYKGKALLPAQTYYWKLRVWDKNNKASAWSSLQNFSTGLFTQKDWAAAKWIGYEQLDSAMRVAPGVPDPYATGRFRYL